MNTHNVSTQWLKENLNNPDLIILDASQLGNKAGLTAQIENIKIKSARIFDIKNKFSDTNSEFPNTLLSEKAFEMACQQIGINQNSKIVVYDNLGIYTSPRVWWMFKTMGHNNIAVLDGGFPAWIAQGNETEEIKSSNYQKGNFKAQFNSPKAKDYAAIKNNLRTQQALVIDARSEGRFKGITPEPRADLRGGNIPQSINIPFQEVLENGYFKSKASLTEVFSHLNTNQPLIFSCGSGITACIILMAYEMVMGNETAVYDGSWTEWATLEN